MPEGAQFCGTCGAGAPEAAAPEQAVEQPATPELIGRNIAGRYRLLRLIGEGGMGSVYEGEQLLGTARRSVAVKLLRPEWSHDVGVKARFHREAETVARLEHFNTVRIYDFGATEEGTLFIVMEYLEGRSLARVLRDQGPLPAERVLHIVRQVVASLTEAHGLGIIHRDLKPDNILLLEHFASQRDVVKLVDFGIAKGQPAAGASTTKLTEFGAFVGTPAYMSPEQFSASSVGPQSDIYSLAVTTYQMLTGRLPFDAQSALEWARAHMVTPPPPLGNAAIPQAMERAVLRALAKDSEGRPASAAQFLRELSGAEGRDGAAAAVASTALASVSVPPVAAAAAPSGVPAAAPPVAPAATPGAAARSVFTAPMTQIPDFAAPRAIATTQPVAAVAGAGEPARPARQLAATLSAPPGRPSRSLARGAVWALLVLAGGATLALGLLALSGGELELWPGQASAPEASPAGLGPASPPEPVTIAPLEAVPAAAPPRALSPSSSTTSRPPPATPAPARPPSTTPAIPAAPGLPLPVPLPPGVPAAGGSAGTALPAPGTTPPAAGLPAPPALPWNLPGVSSAGACERCLAALGKTDHYAVVNAAAENLLCEDRVARERCERQMDEVAPAHAERVAKEGDCPAALATVAAAVQARVSPERFRAIDALCLR